MTHVHTAPSWRLVRYITTCAIQYITICVKRIVIVYMAHAHTAPSWRLARYITTCAIPYITICVKRIVIVYMAHKKKCAHSTFVASNLALRQEKDAPQQLLGKCFSRVACNIRCATVFLFLFFGALQFFVFFFFFFFLPSLTHVRHMTSDASSSDVMVRA